MKKRSIALLLVGIFLLANVSLISATEVNNKIGDGSKTIKPSTVVTEKFLFAKINSSGLGFVAVNNPILLIIEYSNPNATTTITSLFGLHSITIQGNYTLTILFPCRLGRIDVPVYYGNISLDCRARVVWVDYQI